MKTLITLSIVIFLSINSHSQQFSKLSIGDIVNTASGSRSVNFIDINNDNFQDILITNGKTGGENNMLYLNNNGMSFSLIEDALTNDGTPSDGATCADFDNDGFTDVFVVNWYNINNLLYKNAGNGSFNKIDTGLIVTDGGYSETAAWGDADNDGFVDLYVTNSAGDKSNFLFRNTGTGHFEEMTSISPTSNEYYSRSVNWIDYDNDGDQDLYVTNENNQKNNLYRNEGNFEFTKITDNAIVSDSYSSMSSSWADYDNDGDFDLFISNYQRSNQLFTNEGDGSFTETSGPWNDDVGCSFSSSFSDYDNDGDLDLFVTNGYCSNNLENFLYSNNGDGSFSKVSDELPATDLGNSYGCAWGDYDNDGFLELVVANWQGETQNNYIYKNNGNENNWLKVKLNGVETNRSAIGVKVRCKAVIDGDAIWQTREISSQSGYCSQNSLVAHFGLGDASSIDSLQILWNSGAIQTLTNLSVNEMIHLDEENNYVAVSNIEVNGEEDKTTIEEIQGTLQMLATVLPENASNTNIIWSVEDVTATATISESGLLQATGTEEGNGIVLVIATANDNSGVSGSLEITISNQLYTGIENLSKGITVYPNPANDFLKIKSDYRIENLSMEIMNIHGQIVFREYFKTLQDERNFDLSSLSKGLYILKLANTEFEEKKKIIINE